MYRKGQKSMLAMAEARIAKWDRKGTLGNVEKLSGKLCSCLG